LKSTAWILNFSMSRTDCCFWLVGLLFVVKEIAINSEQSQTWRELADDPGNFYCRASDQDREDFKTWLRTLLTETAVSVEFEKSDGSAKHMICTLSEILGAKRVNTVTEHVPNPEVCVVWDCEKDAWRSFRWDRLKRIEFSLG
jgi:hypothetical protein